jgi:hypothetical protein
MPDIQAVAAGEAMKKVLRHAKPQFPGSLETAFSSENRGIFL